MLSICNKCLTPLVLQVYIIPDTTLCFRKICIKPDTTLCILKYVFINTLQTFSLRTHKVQNYLPDIFAISTESW